MLRYINDLAAAAKGRGHGFRFKKALALTALLAAGSAWADPLFVNYDNFNYTGTVTRYATLADAIAKSNAISTTPITTVSNGPRSTLTDARDGNLYVAKSASASYDADTAYFSTAWYYTTSPANGNGWGNPNNTNTGFVQYYDLSSTPTVTGGWSSSLTTFTVDVSGGDGDTYDVGRLWAAPKVGGPSGDTSGVFRDFHLNLVADFAAAAIFNPSTGWYEANANPTALSGTASGIFENQSTTDSSLNGFYAFDFSFAPGSWAAANGATWSEDFKAYSPTAFFAAPADAPVPEPGALALAGLAIGLLSLTRRQRRS